MNGSYCYKMLHELTQLSVHGTRAYTYKLANQFIIGEVLFIFAKLYLLVATLWVGSPTKVRQCWKLIAQESLCHLAVLNLWRDLIVQNSVLILVYKHSCWVHSLCQQYAYIVIENYPVGSCMHCKQCSCRCCFTLIIRQ